MLQSKEILLVQIVISLFFADAFTDWTEETFKLATPQSFKHFFLTMSQIKLAPVFKNHSFIQHENIFFFFNQIDLRQKISSSSYLAIQSN